MSDKSKKVAFQQIPNAALRSGLLSGSESLVLMALWSYTPNIWPGLLQLEEDTGLTSLTIRRSLDSLQDRGVIHWAPYRRGRRYSIVEDVSKWAGTRKVRAPKQTFADAANQPGALDSALVDVGGAE